MVLNDDLGLAIDLQCGSAARALHLKELTAGVIAVLCHTGIVTQSLPPVSPLLFSDCWRMEAVFSWITQYGYIGLFVSLMFGIVGLPVPDETLLTFCGYLIWKGNLQAPETFLAGFGGSVCGISLSYALGRIFGYRFVRTYGQRFGATEERIETVHLWYRRVGLWLLSVGYFVPGVRHFTALVAGFSKIGIVPFAVFAYSGAAVWVAVFLGIGYFVGNSWHHTSDLIHRYALLGTAVAAIVILVVLFVKRRKRRN